MVFNWNKFKEILIHRKGLGILGFSDISASVITSVFWFYIASVMQPEEYGEIFYFIAIISIAFTFSSIGTQNSIIVITAKEKNLQSTFNFISLLAGVACSLLLIIIFYQVDIILLLFGYIMNTLSLSYLIGKRLYSKYSIFLLAQKVLTLVLGVSFFYLYGAEGILFALGLSYLGFLVIIIQSFRKSPINFRGFKNNLTFILHNYSMKAIGTFKEHVDKLILVPLIGFSFLGNYALAIQFISVLSISNTFLSKYLLTNDSRNISNKNLKKFYFLINVCIGISAAIMLPIFVPFFFPQFTDIGILGIMCLAIIPTSITMLKHSEFLGNENTRPTVLGAIIATSVMICGMLILVPEIGIIGAAITYLSTYSSQACFLVIYSKFFDTKKFHKL